MEQRIRKAEVPLYERLAFALADFFGGGAQALITAIYTVFLTMNGVPIALAGVIVAVAKAWDAVNDPLIGVLSDNTRSRFGRRKPYILFGGALVVLSFALLFLPLYGINSVYLKFAVYLFSYLVYSTVASIVLVPYYSLSTEISTSYRETTRINTLRLYFSMASGGVSALVPVYLIDKLHAGSLSVTAFSMLIVFGFGSVYSAPLILCGVLCKERAPVPDQKSELSYRSFLLPFRVKAFRYLLMIYLCGFTCLDIISVNIVYFTKYSLRLPVPSFILLLSIMAAYIGMMPVLSLLMKKGCSKPSLIRMGIPLYISSAAALALLPQGAPAAIAITLCLLIGAGMSGCQMMPWILFPDVVDVAELKLGARVSGSFSGIMTFARKATSALAIAVTGFTLQAAGFLAPVADSQGAIPEIEQSLSAQWGLRLIILIPISLLISVVFVYSGKLRLKQAVSRQIQNLLQKRRNSQRLTEAEDEILARIQAELF